MIRPRQAPGRRDEHPARIHAHDAAATPHQGRHVTAEDARALADALERALPDIPGHNALEDKTVWVGQPPVPCIPFGTPTTPFEWFSGAKKQT